MSTKITDRIDPFTAKATVKSKKQKRSQGSSHYRANTAPELQALPHLKGVLCFTYWVNLVFRYTFVYISVVTTLCWPEFQILVSLNA